MIHPTEAQILAAYKFEIAKQYRDFVQTEFDVLKDQILQSETYHFDEIYYSQLWKERGLYLPEDRIIRKAKDLDLISGAHHKGREGYTKSDSYKFSAEFGKRVARQNFKYRANALLKAEDDVHYYQRQLISVTESFHGLSTDEIFAFKNKEQLIADILAFIRPDFNTQTFKEIKNKFYGQRLILPLETIDIGYKRDMQSFKKFQDTKKHYTVEAFIQKTGDKHEAGYYDSVEAVYEYEEGYFIYAIKDNEHWRYKPSRSCRRKYIALFKKDKYYDNNELESVESALFANFLAVNGIA